MESVRRFAAIVLADARQRWRAPRFLAGLLILVAATWFCFPAADAGYRVLGIGPYRTAYSPAWAGMVVAMLMSWLSLIGFYLVRGTVTRDIETRCWQLLVATPLSRFGYLLAKWVSHLLVLGAIALGMLAVAWAALLVHLQAPSLEPVQMLLPFLVLGLPALGICALCAVLFDLDPALRRTLGNTVYVALWVAMLASASLGGGKSDPTVRIGDVHGISVFKRDVVANAARQGIDADAQRICMLCGSTAEAAAPILWTRWSPAPADLLGRVFWWLLPLPLLALASRVLDRAAAVDTTTARERSPGRRLAWLRVVLSPLQRGRGTALVSLELQHTLRERSGLAWLMLLALWVVQLSAAAGVASLAVIGAWAVFLPVFSRAAAREREFGVADVVFSAVAAGTRLLRVRGAVLLLVGLACGAPALIRFAWMQPLLGIALLGVTVSLVAWALALGSAARSARPFELSFVLGGLLALNGVGALDVSVAPLPTLLAHLALLPLALLLLAITWPRLIRAAARA